MIFLQPAGKSKEGEKEKDVVEAEEEKPKQKKSRRSDLKVRFFNAEYFFNIFLKGLPCSFLFKTHMGMILTNILAAGFKGSGE